MTHAGGSEIWSHGREYILCGEHIGVQKDIFKEIRTWVSRCRLSEISRFNIPGHAASRALFPENAFSAMVDSCEGWQSRAVRESPGGLRRRLFLWKTNSRIWPMSTISGGASEGIASKVGWIEGARVSGVLKERGCFERVASSTARQQGQRSYTSN